MRALRVIVSVLAVAVISVGVIMHFLSKGKDEKPILKITADDTIEASVNITDEELLQYASAYDAQDGDLTDKVAVTRKNFFVQNGVSKVVFSVCDSDNNVTSVSRKIYFKDYRSPEIILKNDFIFTLGSSVNFARLVSAEDIIDGDLTAYLKLISTEFSTYYPGEYMLNLKVSNSMADSTDIMVKAIVTEEDYTDATINLSKYITYINPGEELDFASFVTSVSDNKKRGYGIKNVIIEAPSVEEMQTPGVYDVFYKIVSGKDENAKIVTLTRLVVVVREGE